MTYSRDPLDPTTLSLLLALVAQLTIGLIAAYESCRREVPRQCLDIPPIRACFIEVVVVFIEVVVVTVSHRRAISRALL